MCDKFLKFVGAVTLYVIAGKVVCGVIDGVEDYYDTIKKEKATEAAKEMSHESEL